MAIEELILAARGRIEIDLLLMNARLVNVFNGKIYSEDVAVHNGYIVGFGNYKAKKRVNLKHKYLMPGFIDGHVHIESSMVEIPEFARTVIPLGTTSVIIDPHEIANVFGLDGIKYMLEASKYNPLNVFIMLPSCVPSTPLETSGAELYSFDINLYLQQKWVLGLGELMNYPGVLSCNKEVLNKIKISSSANKRIDGHAPALSGKDLYAYISSGVKSDHECTKLQEAKEKLACGMYIMIREGSAAKNLSDLIAIVNEDNYNRVFFVTDDRNPEDICSQGHINYLIKLAINNKINPVTAIRMATINAAQYYGLNNLGAIAPGYMADAVVVEDLHKFNIKMVFKKGELVAADGQFIFNKLHHRKSPIRSSINVHWLSLKDFQIKAKKERAKIIKIIQGQIVTKKIIENVKTKEGLLVSDTKKDILKLVVIDRHRASGEVGYGLVKGFGFKKGAIASSVSHDSHNIICVGTNDEDMLTACLEIVKMGGGLCVAEGEKILARLPLPIAGLMSDKTLVEVKNSMHKLIKITEQLGSKIRDPFMSLSFLSLPVIPELKLTNKGLVDVDKFEIVDLWE